MEIFPSFYVNAKLHLPSSALQFAYTFRLYIEFEYCFDDLGVMLLAEENIYLTNNQMVQHTSNITVMY